MTATEVSVVTETLPGSQLGLTIEVPPEQVDLAFERVVQRLGQRVRVEGFRPGKAPRPLVEARVGQAAIRDGVVDVLVSPAVSQALRERSIEAIERPEVEIQELERGRAARFTARVSVMPEVRLPDLASLPVQRTHTVVDEDMVERRIAELRERLAQVEPVDRAVQAGDLVVGDLRVTVDGEEVTSESRRATEVEVREGALVPELLAVLPGRAVGDVTTADVTLPEDHSDPALRGRPATLEFTVQGVKEKRVPELTDEVAAELSGGEQAAVESFRPAVREDLEEQARRYDELAFEQAAVRAVTEASQFEVPHALVEREVDRHMEELERRLAQRGLRLERYLQHVDKTEADYRAEVRPDAESRIRVDLVLEELGRQMAISPSEDEVTERMRAEAERDEPMRRELDQLLRNQLARSYFRHRVTRMKVLEELVAQLGGAAAEAAPAGAETGEKAE